MSNREPAERDASLGSNLSLRRCVCGGVPIRHAWTVRAAQPPPLAFPLPLDPELPAPLRSPPLALPLPVGAELPLPEPELEAGARPEPVLGGAEGVVGVLGARAGGGVVWTTLTGAGLAGWLVTTGVAAGTDDRDGDRCEVT
jgi:hypothetical protein